jgi:hypothetical protein
MGYRTRTARLEAVEPQPAAIGSYPRSPAGRTEDRCVFALPSVAGPQAAIGLFDGGVRATMSAWWWDWVCDRRFRAAYRR